MTTAYTRLLAELDTMTEEERDRLAAELARRGGGTFRSEPYEREDEWAPGPWDEEPYSEVVWSDTWTGLRCRMRRNNMGAWCGYVAIPQGHPFHGEGYDEEQIYMLDVHGGITYAGGLRDFGWAIGFDCNHSFDQNAAPWGLGGGEYRDMWYVRSEVAKLAAQVHAARE